MMAAVTGRGSSCCDAAHSEAMGKYLRAIYLLSFKAPPVLTSHVAARLGVAPPSVSAMLRRVDRVGDEDSAALQYLAELGIRPGVVLRVLEREPFGGPLWVEVGGQRRAMGTPLTHLVHGVVEP